MTNPETSFEQIEARIREVSLDLDSETMRQAGYRVIDYLVERFSAIRETALGRELSREQTEQLLREPLPEEPKRFELVLEEFKNKVAPNAIQLDHPRFFAFIPSAPNFISVLADALMAGTNVFAGTWLESSGPSQVEILVIDWFKEILGLPREAGGLLVSGGSIANLTALAVARESRLGDGMEGARVYLTSQAHACVDRALRILGIKADQLCRIPTDSGFRMDRERLEWQVRQDRLNGLTPFAVVASAGTTNTGAVDPLAEIASVAAAESLWFHVDAAYGGFAAMTERGKAALEGIERADSVVLDPHKWLYCPFEAGCVMVRDRRRMHNTFRILPEYMRDVAREEQDVNFCDYGLQLTRSFRALKIWMALKTFGASRFRQIIDQCLDLAIYGARLVANSRRLALVTPPSLGVFTFRYVPERLRASGEDSEDLINHLNERLMSRITASRKLMLSSTQLGSRYVLRFCVLNHRTRKEDLRQALCLVEELGWEEEQHGTGVV